MAKAGPMPTHQGLRSDDSDGPEHRWKPSIQQDQEQAIPICELDATAHPALPHNQLMTERRVLGLKSALRLERRDGQGSGRGRRVRSSPLTLGDSVTQSIRMRFSVHTAGGAPTLFTPTRLSSSRVAARHAWPVAAWGKITAAHIVSCNAQNCAAPLGRSVGAANIPKCRRLNL